MLHEAKFYRGQDGYSVKCTCGWFERGVELSVLQQRAAAHDLDVPDQTKPALLRDGFVSGLE
jgi:hypothetical protein